MLRPLAACLIFPGARGEAGVQALELARQINTTWNLFGVAKLLEEGQVYGRIGRDDLTSTCVTLKYLPSIDSQRIWNFLVVVWVPPDGA